MPKKDEIEIEDDKGRKVTVTLAHWNRYPQLHDSFRPVSEKKATVPVVVTPAPTGDENKEN